MNFCHRSYTNRKQNVYESGFRSGEKAQSAATWQRWPKKARGGGDMTNMAEETHSEDQTSRQRLCSDSQRWKNCDCKLEQSTQTQDRFVINDNIRICIQAKMCVGGADIQRTLSYIPLYTHLFTNTASGALNDAESWYNNHNIHSVHTSLLTRRAARSMTHNPRICLSSVIFGYFLPQ